MSGSDSSSSGKTAEPQDERTVVAQLMEEHRAMKEGDKWYPVPFKWNQVWRAFVGMGVDGPAPQDMPHPGTITASELADSDIPVALNKQIRDQYDYVLVPEAVWTYLVEKYGSDAAFPRTVRLTDSYEAIVELYPQPVRLTVVGATAEEISAAPISLWSRALDGDDLRTRALAALNLPTSTPARLWASDGTNLKRVGSDVKLGDIAGDDALTQLQLERQKDDGTWALNEADLAAATSVPAEGAAGGPEDDDEKRDSDPEPFDEVAWRAGLKKDDRVDARDSEGKWYESVLVDYKAATDQFLVHYRGWESRWDSWKARNAPDVVPLHTETKPFRNFKVGDAVEYKYMNRWYEAKIDEVSKDADTGAVTVKVTCNAAAPQSVDSDSELLCAPGTHVRTAAAHNAYSSYSSFHGNTMGRPTTPGAVGLHNLGNTCFMNSMLQCLSNTKALTQFFLSGEYKKDVNADNPLGHGGALAEAYGELLRDMWTGKFTAVSPTNLKRQIGTRARQFAGYQQQDSQELMSFLLDGLHEDLNRIKKKPYVESKEYDGKSDAEASDESWSAYLKRNKSVIVDVFQGQLRSHVQCNVCSKDSVTFDPFMSLSVPIPVKQSRDLVLTWIPYDGSVPIRFWATVDKHGSVADLKAWLASRMTDRVAEQLIVCDTYSHRVFRYLPDSSPVSDIRDNDFIFVFDLPVLPGESTLAPAPKRSMAMGMYHQENTPVRLTKHSEGVVQLLFRREVQFGITTRLDGFGDPHMVSLYGVSGERGRMPTNNQLHQLVWSQVKRLINNNDSFTEANPPYVLGVATPNAYTAATPIPRNDAAFVIDPETQCLFVEMTAAQYRDHSSSKELMRFEQHASSTERRSKTTGVELGQCFSQFSVREQLGENDKWYCPRCKEHQRAYKKMDLWRMPEVLIVHLKRFQYSESHMFVHRDKIDVLVDFPLTLDMRPYVLSAKDGEDYTYEAYAVSNHAGNLGGGHYTACALNFKNNRWYDFNDSFVSEISTDRIVSPLAYVVFYRRKRATDA